MKGKQAVRIILTEEQLKGLGALAKEASSISEVVRRAIDEYFAHEVQK